MNDALTFLYYIFDKFVNLVFNQLEIVSNVSIGWIAMSILIFSIMIRSILNLPKGMGNFSSVRRRNNE